MQHILTYTVSVVCSEEQADRIRNNIVVAIDGEEIPDAKVVGKLIDEELLDDGADAVKMLTERYKSIGL